MKNPRLVIFRSNGNSGFTMQALNIMHGMRNIFEITAI
jgi:hypothetical protein